jgi:hypothetical protein
MSIERHPEAVEVDEASVERQAQTVERQEISSR